MRGFYFARKVEDKQIVLDENGNEVLAYPEAQLPEYQTRHSAGADFFCAEEVKIPSIWSHLISCLIADGSRILPNTPARENTKELFHPTLVHTGVKARMYEDEALFLYNRSSGPKKKGLVLANSVGVVDADYADNPDNDGEIMFAFYNFFPWSVTLKVGDRIGQGVFQKFLRPEEGLRVKDTKRISGYGSTDK